jgi:hypothetical protein
VAFRQQNTKIETMQDTRGSAEDLHDEHDEEKVDLDGDEEETK